MSFIEVIGGRPLSGEIKVQGSKNAALPLLAAAVLHRGESRIKNCPGIRDIGNMEVLLGQFGCRTRREERTLIIDASDVADGIVTGAEVKRTRASVLFMGALSGRGRHAAIAYPGGCSIGERKIDFHIDALRKMRVNVEEKDGTLCFDAKELCGSDIVLKFPSVGATENIILAAVLARGTTRIQNAATEPEIGILCEFLNGAGARISCRGNSITIEGVKELRDTEYVLPGDRIVAGTYLTAAAGTGGKVRVAGVRKEELNSLIAVLREAGCEIGADAGSVTLAAKLPLRAVSLATAPYPGFPTDMQSLMMALMCGASGESRITETIFENRFHTAGELARMGAEIRVEGNTASITGGGGLTGAEVTAGDLRDGAALVTAGLFAKGRTTVRDPEDYIRRGYEDITGDLRKLGACVREY
ncbi:MAG TPA: UDP-N-acetylglucosamine 1-carboxyvinyltransferase [Candidatus Caccomorpha excrementavium]|nr:UDP-N-acetylglucosamine 1-carboxyvinyltransferase [Candidatus Caccomorpha excrementavium]